MFDPQSASLLLVGGDRETPASLAAAIGEHTGASGRLHPGPKTVLSLAAQIVGLVGALRHGEGGTNHMIADPSSRGPPPVPEKLDVGDGVSYSRRRPSTEGRGRPRPTPRRYGQCMNVRDGLGAHSELRHS